jgi:hypothetical protein
VGRCSGAAFFAEQKMQFLAADFKTNIFVLVNLFKNQRLFQLPISLFYRKSKLPAFYVNVVVLNRISRHRRPD